MLGKVDSNVDKNGFKAKIIQEDNKFTNIGSKVTEDVNVSKSIFHVPCNAEISGLSSSHATLKPQVSDIMNISGNVESLDTSKSVFQIPRTASISIISNTSSLASTSIISDTSSLASTGIISDTSSLASTSIISETSSLDLINTSVQQMNLSDTSVTDSKLSNTIEILDSSEEEEEEEEDLGMETGNVKQISSTVNTSSTETIESLQFMIQKQCVSLNYIKCLNLIDDWSLDRLTACVLDNVTRTCLLN